jgi:hypothetical protein
VAADRLEEEEAGRKKTQMQVVRPPHSSLFLDCEPVECHQACRRSIWRNWLWLQGPASTCVSVKTPQKYSFFDRSTVSLCARADLVNLQAKKASGGNRGLKKRLNLTTCSGPQE